VNDAERWERTQALFHAALELPEAERDAYLRRECGADEPLRQRVAAMIAIDGRGNTLLDGGVSVAAERVLGIADGALSQQAFGPYHVTGVLGEGGMGVVYRGRRDDLASEAAIKVLRDALLSPARRERFAFEQRALARLDHPAIARLFDAEALPDGTPWFAMELVDGVPITDYCRSHGLRVVDRLRLVRDVCEAVQHAHARAILHRDLKPSNILVRPDGRVKLLDFGIAKPLDALEDAGLATRTGLRMMTPAYAAPEQVTGGALGVHTDVYALGVLLYELLADRLPFDLEGRTPSEAALLVTEQAPARPSTVARATTPASGGDPGRAAWKDLDVLCMTAMHRDPGRRYVTVDALMRDLDRYLRGEPLEARGDSFRYRAGKLLRRHAPVVTAIAVAFAAVVAVVTFYTIRLAASRDAARAEAARSQRIQRFMTELFEGGADDAGPADTLRVVTLLDRGIGEASSLAGDPVVQADLERTLGGIYQALGRMDRADSALSLAYAHASRLRPANDGIVVQAEAALALLRSDQARHDEAETLARRAYDRARGRLAPRDPRVADATSTLGRVLEARGEYVAAIPLLREAVDMAVASGQLAAESTAMTDLANTYYYLGRLAESDSINTRVLALDRRLYGAHHPNVANDLLNLGASRRQLGHYADAERDSREALAISRAWYGEKHPLTAACLTDIARTLELTERYDEAEPLVREAMEIDERVFGPTHPQVAGALNEMGGVAQSRERFDDAVAYYRRAADIYRRTYGAHHTSLAVALANVGSVYLDERSDARAEVWFRQAIAAYPADVHDDDVDLAIAHVKLGRALLRQHRAAEAIVETRRAYRTLVALTDAGTSFVHAARTDLIAEYKALGHADSAAAIRREGAETTATR
jgi:serine/threonine-protein kinase